MGVVFIQFALNGCHRYELNFKRFLNLLPIKLSPVRECCVHSLKLPLRCNTWNVLLDKCWSVHFVNKNRCFHLCQKCPQTWAVNSTFHKVCLTFSFLFYPIVGWTGGPAIEIESRWCFKPIMSWYILSNCNMKNPNNVCAIWFLTWGQFKTANPCLYCVNNKRLLVSGSIIWSTTAMPRLMTKLIALQMINFEEYTHPGP